MRSSYNPFKMPQVGYVRSSLPILMHFGSIVRASWKARPYNKPYKMSSGLSRAVLQLHSLNFHASILKTHRQNKDIKTARDDYQILQTVNELLVGIKHWRTPALLNATLFSYYNRHKSNCLLQPTESLHKYLLNNCVTNSIWIIKEIRWLSEWHTLSGVANIAIYLWEHLSLASD